MGEKKGKLSKCWIQPWFLAYDNKGKINKRKNSQTGLQSNEQFPFYMLTCIMCLCAKLLQSCLTLCDPMDCSPPGSSVHEILQERILDTQSCPTLCDPMDCSPPGSFVHGILQARILEWVAISFSTLPSGKPPGKPNLYYILWQLYLKKAGAKTKKLKNLYINRHYKHRRKNREKTFQKYVYQKEYML